MSNVNHPSHYNSGKIEVIEAIEDWKLDYHCGNAVKYVARAGKKDPSKEIEDLEKATWYLKRKIEKLKAANEGRSATRPNDMNPRSTSATAVCDSSNAGHRADIAKSVVGYVGEWCEFAGYIGFFPHMSTDDLRPLLGAKDFLYRNV